MSLTPKLLFAAVSLVMACHQNTSQPSSEDGLPPCAIAWNNRLHTEYGPFTDRQEEMREQQWLSCKIQILQDSIRRREQERMRERAADQKAWGWE